MPNILRDLKILEISGSTAAPPDCTIVLVKRDGSPLTDDATETCDGHRDEKSSSPRELVTVSDSQGPTTKTRPNHGGTCDEEREALRKAHETWTESAG